jgi:hypothetical protein
MRCAGRLKASEQVTEGEVQPVAACRVSLLENICLGLVKYMLVPEMLFIHPSKVLREPSFVYIFQAF